MAEASSDFSEPRESKTPNHMVFWLDEAFGDPQYGRHLKKAFSSNTDPRCETWTMLTDTYYSQMVLESQLTEMWLENIHSLFQTFDNINACLAAFEANQDKRIFFITSDTMGGDIVETVLERYRHVFTDPITNEPYPSIYVLCHIIGDNVGWAMRHYEHIQIFNHDQDLLQRMTRDIGQYFVERGRRLHAAADPRGALKQLEWAKRLFHQYEKMHVGGERSTHTYLRIQDSADFKEMNILMTSIEAMLHESLPDDEET